MRLHICKSEQVGAPHETTLRPRQLETPSSIPIPHLFHLALLALPALLQVVKEVILSPYTSLYLKVLIPLLTFNLFTQWHLHSIGETRYRPNRPAANMENLNFGWFLRIFWRPSWGFLEYFWRILEKLVRCLKIKNFHQSETNKENEVLRPLWPPNSLGGQIWPQIWNQWPQLPTYPCAYCLYCMGPLSSLWGQIWPQIWNLRPKL